GGVPLFTEKRLSTTDSRSLQRASKEEVYAQIEADLKSAIAVLPPTQSQKGRITQYAAKALLGKVYLYQTKYNEAATVLEQIIAANAFTLVDDFASRSEERRVGKEWRSQE